MKKKATIGGASPKPAKNTTGATNRTSGYLNPKAAGNKNATPKTATTITKSGRKITITGSSSPSSNVGSKSVKPGSMVTNTKVVDSGSKKKPSTSYSPAPMSAAAKKKAAAQGKKTESKTLLRTLKPIKSERGSSTISKVVGRAKTVAREVRDIPTAVGTAIRATAAGKPKPGTNTPLNKQAMYAKYDLKQQVKQVASAVKSGTKGTPAVQYGKDRKKR